MTDHDANRERSALIAICAGLLCGMWQFLRWSVYAILCLLSPLVRFTTLGIALLALTTALFFGVALERPHFPFLGTLVVSLASLACLFVYDALTSFLSPRDSSS